MYLSTELMVNGRLLRGNVRAPDSEGPFPTVVFLHGFTVWKTGPQRLYELFVRQCVENGFAVVRYDFYGCGESDGDFNEMTISSELEETKAIYAWTMEQPYVDRDRVFLAGHSMGALLVTLAAPALQPRAAVIWAPAMTMYYQASMRARTMRGPTARGYDIDGLELSKEFLDEAAGMDFAVMARGYHNPVLILHGAKDLDIPVECAYRYKKIYGDCAELDILPEANHRFLSLPWKQYVYDRSITFLKKHGG